MNTSFVRRNVMLFFRDRTAVLLSLIAVFIVIILYAVFLGDVWLNDSMDYIDDPDILMNSWIVAGLLTIASITTTMGAFNIMVDDRVKKIDKDFYSSPMKRNRITLGYIGSAFLIGVIMTIVTIVVAQLYIVLQGGNWFSPVMCGELFLLILLSVLTSTSIVCFIISLIKSQSAFGTASTILGTMIGFLTGVYLPVGALPASVQSIINAFPLTHSASLFRQIMMEDGMNTSFSHAPPEALGEFKEYMGVTICFGDLEISALVSVIILIVTTVIFFGLSVLNMSRKRM